MAISSLIVEALPDSLDAVQERLAAYPGVEVHGADAQTGRIVVTIEAESIDASHELASSFIEIPNVWNVNLVYVSVEDELDAKHERERSEAGVAATGEPGVGAQS